MTAPDSARWWLRLALGDLAGASAFVATAAVPPREAAYFAHQAVEKALKAAIAANDRAPALSHDLLGLRADGPESLRAALPAQTLRPLLFVDLVAHYPADESELIDRETAHGIVRAASDVIERLSALLEDAGVGVGGVEAA